MKLVCIGDSLTYGYGVPSHSSWVESLKLYFDIEVINKGVNGDTTSGILSRSYRDVIMQKPDYVIIMAGTNDFLMNYPLESVKNNMKLLIKEAKDNKILPIIALQPPIVAELAEAYWEDGINYEKSNGHLSLYLDWIKVYSKDDGIIILNFFDRFIDENNIKNLFSDGIHPNAAGHRLMFLAAAELIRKLIL